MRLLDVQGRNVTPKGSLRCALLAILALSLHGTKARVKLQDMLWSASDQELGSQSLRTALSLLKRELSVLPVPILEADKHVVRLDISNLWIDVTAYLAPGGGRLLRSHYGGELPDLLEGLNVRAAEDDGFEDWLREERRFWSEKLEPLLDEEEDAVRDPPEGAGAAEIVQADADHLGLHVEPSIALPHASVGLLPTITSAGSIPARFLGDTILDWITIGLREYLLAEVYDYRDGKGGQDIAEGLGPSILLQTKVFEEPDRLMVTLLAYRASQQRLLWTWTFELPGIRDFGPQTAGVTAFVNQAVDRICLSIDLSPIDGSVGGLRSTPSMRCSGSRRIRSGR